MKDKQNLPQIFSFAINGSTFYIRNNASIFSLSEFRTGMHQHHVAEIHYLYSGSERLTYIDPELHRENVMTVEEGQLLLIPPHIFHSMESNSHILRITFTFEIQGSSDFYKLGTNAISEMKKPSVFSDDYFRSVFSVIREKIEEEGIYFNQYRRQLMITSVVTMLTDILLQKFPHTEPSAKLLPEADRNFLIRDFICRSEVNNDSLDNLASLLHLSTKQTQTVVKRLMGKNFKSLILESKMQLAKALVQGTDRSLSSIAEDIGYRSYSSFYTAYKKYHGVTPLQHRPDAEE